MKKALTLLLALAMLAAMAACSTAAPTAIPTGAQTSAPTQAPTATVEPTAAAPEVVTLTCFLNYSWYPTDKWEGIIPQQITKDTGVSLDCTIATDGNQLGVMVASGELSDLVYSSKLRDRLSSPELCYSYDELIGQYKVDWEIDPMARGNSLLYSTDGKAYMLLNQFSSTADWQKAASGVPMLPSLVYRKDLYEKLGSPKLDTLDDLAQVFELVKQSDASITPLAFDAYWKFKIFRVWTGVTLLDFVKQADGAYKHFINTPEYMAMLKMLNAWYRKGYMSADNFAAADNDAGKPYTTGKAFACTTCTQTGNLSAQSGLNEVDKSMISVECKPLGSTNYKESDIGWSATFITRKCAKPEAAIRFMAYLFSPYGQALTQMGREGAEYTLDTSGLPVFSKEWVNASKSNQQIQIYNPWFYFGGSKIVEAVSRCAALENYKESYEDAYKAIKAGYSNEPWVAAALPTEGMDEKVVYDKISDMVTNFEAKVIMAAGDAEFDKNYAEYMSTAGTAGMADLEAYMSKRIPELEGNYK